jgi:hypothetical protein
MFPSLRSLSRVDVFFLARFRYTQYLRRILLATPALFETVGSLESLKSP